jgi:hypothetical protein
VKLRPEWQQKSERATQKRGDASSENPTGGGDADKPLTAVIEKGGVYLTTVDRSGYSSNESYTDDESPTLYHRRTAKGKLVWLRKPKYVKVAYKKAQNSSYESAGDSTADDAEQQLMLDEQGRMVPTKLLWWDTMPTPLNTRIGKIRRREPKAVKTDVKIIGIVGEGPNPETHVAILKFSEKGEIDQGAGCSENKRETPEAKSGSSEDVVDASQDDAAQGQ